MFSGVKQRFNNMKIGRKLTVMYVGGILVPIFLIFSVFLWGLGQQVNARADFARNASMDRVQVSVTELFEEMYQVGTYFAADTELAHLINNYDPSTDFDIFSTARTIDNRIGIMTWAFPRVDAITLYHSREAFLDRDQLVYIDEEVKNEPWYIRYRNSEEKYYYGTAVVEGELHLTMVNQFSNHFQSYDIILRQDIDSEAISDALQDDYFLESSRIYLLNPEGMIVGTNSIDMSDQQLMTVWDETEMSELGAVYYRPVALKDYTDGWKLAFVLNQGSLINDLNRDIRFFGLAVLLVIGFSIMLLRLYSGSVSQRLTYISRIMKTSQEGELTLADQDNNLDEIGIVQRSYNKMAGQISKLLMDLGEAKEVSDRLLEEKVGAFDELHSTYEELHATYEELASVNQELTDSFEEIKIKDVRIKELIYMDTLTGLNNRFTITNRIEDGLKEHPDALSAVIFVDVDNFKFINDTYGHDVGDLVIKETGNKLREFESETVSIGRFGGDEFLIFVEAYIKVAEVVRLLEEIRESFKQAIRVDGKKFHLTTSMGVATAPEHGRCRNELIKKADMALYRAKDTGKDRYTFYDQHLNENLERRMVLQSAIKEGLVDGEFYLNFQPYVTAKTGALTGYEALIRWNSKTLGRVSPFELITTAEEMGLIVEIGDWVLEEALRFIKKVNVDRETPLKVSVNISAIQLISGDFKERFLGIVNAVGVRPEEVCLEMTETVLIDAHTRRSEDLKSLRDLGFGIALDDFGTGYSSLSYFRELPVTILKIDKSFVDEIEGDTFNMELVRVMMGIAHSKDIQVVAEGVETKGQLEILKALGCDTIQGYYFSQPLSTADALTYGGC